MVTANGSPYGMATTTTVIPKMMKFNICSKSVPVFHYRDNPLTIANLMRSTIMMTKAE
jgi:hypothetical protein